MDRRLYPWLIKTGWSNLKTFEGQAPELSKRLAASEWGRRAVLAWEAEKELPVQRRSLFRAALKLHGRSLLFWCTCSAGLALTQTIGRAAATRQAVLSAQAIGEADEFKMALLSIVVVCGTILVEGFFWTLNEHFCEVCFGPELVASMTHLMVHKASRIAGVADTSETVLFGIDLVGKVNSQIWYFCMMPYCPVCFFVGSACLIAEFGVSGAVGVATLSVGMFVGNWTSTRAKASEWRALKASEERLLLVRDILTSIKGVKALAWEDKFLRSLDICRSHETLAYRRYHQLRAMGANIGRCLPVLGASATIVTAAFLEERPLRADEIFPLLALLHGMRDTLCMSPTQLVYVRSFLLSLQRLQRYLEVPEISQFDVSPAATEDSSSSKSIVEVSEATIHYPGHEQVPVLSNVWCSVSAGSLVGVVGAVASGKTALLRCLLAEMVCSAGKVHVSATSVGFCPQAPMLISGTITENVVMGRVLDEQQLNIVLEACALHDDLKMWPASLDTWVGERGISVSGGQAQRINLARALYMRPQLLVLDDVFAKLDVTTADHTFREGICSQLGQDGAVVMSMSQTKFLPMCDIVYSLQHETVCRLEHNPSGSRYDSTDRPSSNQNVKVTLRSTSSSVEDVARHAWTEEASASTSRGIIYRYFSHAGCMQMAIVVALASAAYGCLGFNDVWITKWVAWAEDHHDKRGSTTEMLFGIVTISSSVLFTVLSTLASLALFVLLSKSGQLFHTSTMKSLLRAKLGFWEQTSSGRILSSLSTDLAAIDSQFGMFIEMQLQFLLNVLSLLLVQAILAPLFLLVFPVAVGAGFFIFHVTATACSQMQKHTNLAETPLLTNFSNLLDCRGMARPMGLTNFFIFRHHYFLDAYHRSWYWAFAVRICGATASYVMASLLAAVLQAILWAQSSTPEVVGLAVSYSLIFAFFVYLCVGMTITLQSGVTQIKRLFDLQSAALVPAEAPWELHDAARQYAPLPQVCEGSRCGSITIDNVAMRYQPEPLPPTLGPLTFTVPSGKRLGICGRTGAGKSSLFTVMLRFVEPSAGRIVVDGTDLASLRLQDVRKILALIPQEPFVFAGTIRRNLDPFEEFPEAAAQLALHRVGLSRFELQALVQENGEGLSVGERQLVSLARLLLQPAARCILLDEPSASLDTASDDAIQNLLRNESHQRGCSCMCIAHRLGTILDYDLVLLLDRGQVLAIGPPQDLLAVSGSPFSKMVVEQGKPASLHETIASI